MITGITVTDPCIHVLLLIQYGVVVVVGGLDPINAIGVLPGQVCLWAITWRQMTIHTHFHTYRQFRITS